MRSRLINDSSDLETTPDFVVHNYSSFRPTQNSQLLSLGRELIHAASTKTKGWTNVGDTLPRLSRSTNVFQFDRPPIIPIDERGTSIDTIKEWGASFGDDEDAFTLDDLNDFVSTDLTFLFVKKHAPPHPVSPTAEEKRSNLDFGPLHNVVPQPHMHPSPQDTSSKPIKVTPYKRRKPTAIPPHTLPLPVLSPHSRSAWLVPIRGNLPWDDCTSAIILDSSHELPCPSQKTSDPITWTHASLASFWAFLLNLRATCNAGPIGLSFHASRTPLPQGGSLHSTVSYALGLGNQAAFESHATTNPRSTATSTPGSRPPLSSVDHVKIYHEAPTAMYLRNALHVWTYQADASTERRETPEKIRLLKGARLVLVDERSKGILIS